MKLHTQSMETRIYLAAASMNIGGVLLFSRLFTNTAINAADPVVMSNFGLLMIVVWGLAYIGAAASINSKWIAGAFAIEKSVYAVVWLDWMSKHSVANVYAEDAMAGIFFTIYGVNDILCMILFLFLFFKQKPRNRNTGRFLQSNPPRSPHSPIDRAIGQTQSKSDAHSYEFLA